MSKKLIPQASSKENEQPVVIVGNDKQGLVPAIISRISRKSLGQAVIIISLGVFIAVILAGIGLLTGTVDLTSADMKALVNTINQDRTIQHELNEKLTEAIQELKKNNAINSVKINNIEQNVKDIKADIREMRNDKK